MRSGSLSVFRACRPFGHFRAGDRARGPTPVVSKWRDAGLVDEVVPIAPPDLPALDKIDVSLLAETAWRLLHGTDFYHSAIEIDTYDPDVLDGAEVEKYLRRAFAVDRPEEGER